MKVCALGDCAIRTERTVGSKLVAPVVTVEQAITDVRITYTLAGPTVKK